MYEGYYEEKGIEDDAVVLDMGNMEPDSLEKLIKLIEQDNPGDDGLHAIERIKAFYRKYFID